MKYYIVYFRNGFIIDICSWDDCSYDNWLITYNRCISYLDSGQYDHILSYDAVQKFSDVY